MLTVDAPGVQNMGEATKRLGLELWRRAVALATTRSTTLLYYEWVAWHQLPIAVPELVGDTFGLIDGNPCPRADTPTVVFHTGHSDDLARRKFPLWGAPSFWMAGRRMTHGGLAAVETWGQIVMIGLSAHLTGAPMQLLLAYPNLLPAAVGNPSGVAFRRVEEIHGYLLPDRAPEPSQEPWP